MTITWFKRMAIALGGTIIGLTLLGGCLVDRHLHPNAGRAFNTIMYKQAKKGQRWNLAQSEEASAEEIEVVMENFEKQTKYSEFKQQGGMTLLPLQR